MPRNSRFFETPYDVLTALEDVITDALDQTNPKLDADELVFYLDDHFDTADAIYDWKQDNRG